MVTMMRTRMSGDVGTLRQMTIGMLNYCVSCASQAPDNKMQVPQSPSNTNARKKTKTQGKSNQRTDQNEDENNNNDK